MLDPRKATVSDFDGLKLNASLDRVGSGAAIDLLDVDWRAGVLGSREGSKAFSAAEGAGYYDRMFAHTIGSRATAILLARRGTTLVPLAADTGKEVPEKSATVSESHIDFAKMGIAGGGGFFIPVTYIADQENTLKKFSGDVPGETGFESPTATVDGEEGKTMPKGWYVTAWPGGGNRLVVAGTADGGGPNGANSSASHVWFSDPADPEAYESTAYVALVPGEDEDITGCCTWGDQVFVFKETRLFVFYGVSADDEGNPIFNFRSIDLGTQIASDREKKTVNKVAPGRDGVYFLATDGVYVTTGGEPTLLSEDLDPLADPKALPGPAATTFPAETARFRHATEIAYVDDQVYVVLSPTRLLKLDLPTLRWTVWKVALNNIAPWVEEPEAFIDFPRLFFSAKEGAKKIYHFTQEEDEDAAVAMEPRYQSGFDDLGDVDEKTLTNTKLWGTGEVDVKVAEDFGELGTAKTFKLGAGGAIAQHQAQRGQTATLLSYQLSGDAPWSVQRISRYLRETRVPSTEKAA